MTERGGHISPESVETNDVSIENDGEESGIDADSVDGYDIQVDGEDGPGIINFKTE